jgi:hypothetical protein
MQFVCEFFSFQIDTGFMANNLPAVRSVATEIVSAAQVLMLPAGQHAVSLRECRRPVVLLQGMPVPCIQIAVPPPMPGLPPKARLLGLEPGVSAWLTRPGDVMTVEVLTDQAPVIITTYSPASYPDAGLGIRVMALHMARAPMAPRLEAMAHIAQRGDVRAGEGEWLGQPDSRAAIEGFGLKMDSAGFDTSVEYKAYAAGNKESPWKQDGSFCGSRGRRQPLTGFAIRLAGTGASQFDVGYKAAFLSGYVTDVCRNGDKCSSPNADDILVAMRVKISASLF